MFDINLAQEARQSKPPLMHCADWAYNIIPAVTAMTRATRSNKESTIAKPCQTLFPLGAIAFYLRMDKKVFSLLSQFN